MAEYNQVYFSLMLQVIPGGTLLIAVTLGTDTILNVAHHCARGTMENSAESCIDY